MPVKIAGKGLKSCKERVVLVVIVVLAVGLAVDRWSLAEERGQMIDDSRK